MVPHELLTLYLMAAEGASVSSGSQSGARKRFSFEQYEHNVASLAPYIIGQNWSGEKNSLPGGLGACESGLELPHSS